MKIGRRIYFERLTGHIILDTGERSGDVVETSIIQDFINYKLLNERDPETVELLELAYGQFGDDFREKILERVDPKTKELFFIYPEPTASTVLFAESQN